MQTPPRLWHAIECPYSMRVRLVLADKELAYDSCVVSLHDPGDAVRERNPQGSVPVLEHAGCVLYESSIIAEYLEESFPEPALLPRSPAGRARARLLVDWADGQLAPPVRILEDAHFGQGLEGQPTDDEGQQDALHDAEACMRTLADIVPEDGWILGSFGIVEIFLAPFVVQLDTIGVRRDEIPATVAAWIDRLRDRPSVAEQTLARTTALTRPSFALGSSRAYPAGAPAE